MSRNQREGAREDDLPDNPGEDEGSRFDAANFDRKTRLVRSQRSGAIVTVALKHPTGIVLEVFEKVVVKVPSGVPGVMVEDASFRSTGQQWPLFGAGAPLNVQLKCEVINGYALTRGIPKDVWDKWREQHHDHSLVENELIAAFEDHAEAQKFCRSRDHRDLRSGLEKMRPSGDPRAPKRRNIRGELEEQFSRGVSS